MGLTQLCPRADTLTPELVHRLHAEGFVVRAWGVATEDLMRQVVNAGADGMTVNFPDKLIAHLKSATHEPVTESDLPGTRPEPPGGCSRR